MWLQVHSAAAAAIRAYRCCQTNLYLHRSSGRISTSYGQCRRGFQSTTCVSNHDPTDAPLQKDSEIHYDDSLSIHLTTRDGIKGRKIAEELGIVIGTSARSRSIFHDLMQRLRGLIGGELESYGELFANTTAEATHKAMIDAKRLGATAIIRTRYQSAATDSKLTGVSCFVICYGTAVKDEEDH